MEQHLYTHLNQKYGLKSLIIEWASAVMAAVKKFSDEDNDVAVFGRILRNEIDEEFRIVQKQLKDTVAELLRVYLKGKHPLKSEDEVSKLLNKRVKSYVFEEEWTDIIKYMYNHEDSVVLIMKCKDYIEACQASRAPKETRRNRREARQDESRDAGKIMYEDFLKILLDFQLKGHEKFLLKFMKLFRQFDKDKNGVINEEEFRQLIIATDPNKTDKEIQDLLNLVDPHNNQQISFSECVNFLSSDLVHMTS
jgi:Ca2+-binding EF-hand superfamily protein